MDKKFVLHFNRVNMQRKNPNVWTVHYKGKCHQVKKVKCHVSVETIFDKDGQQPRAKLIGYGQVYLDKGAAYIINNRVVDTLSDDDYFEATSGKEV